MTARLISIAACVLQVVVGQTVRIPANQRVPLPAGTAVHRIAVGPAEAWFLGESSLYRWSASGVEQLELPGSAFLRNVVLVEDGSGYLQSDQVLYSRTPTGWKTVPVQSGVRSITGRKTLLVLTVGGKVLRGDPLMPVSLPDFAVTSMAEGVADEVWLSCADGTIWLSGSVEALRIADELPSRVVALQGGEDSRTVFALLADGNWVGLRKGELPKSVTAPRPQWRVAEVDGSSELVHATEIDGQGGTWIGTAQGAYRLDSHDTLPWTTSKAGLIRAHAEAVDEPVRHTSVTVNAIPNYSGARLTALNSSHGLPNDFVSCIVSDGVNTWFTTGYRNLSPDGENVAGAGVVRWDHREFTRVTAGLPSQTVQACAFDPGTGNLYFGTTAGAVRYQNGNVSAVGPAFAVHDIAVGAGFVWVAGEGQVLRIHPTAGTVTTFPVTGRATSIAVDANGSVWAGTSLGLRSFNGSSFVSEGSPPVSNSYIMDIQPDALNNLWISVWNQATFRRTPSGVYSQHLFGPVISGLRRVYRIGRDNSNNMWFSHENFGVGGTPQGAASFLAESQLDEANPVFTVLSRANGLTHNAALSFGAERDAMWVGLPGGGVWRIGGPFAVPGWPKPLSAFPSYSSPLLVDLDHDRDLEIVVADSGGKIYAFRPDGSTLWVYDTASAVPAGAPASTQFVESSPAAGDVDGDGEIEIVVGLGGVFAKSGLSAYGGVLILSRLGQKKRLIETLDTLTTGGITGRDGRPQSVISTPVLANVDADPELEIMVGGLDNQIYAWNGDGTPIYAKDNDGDGRFDEDPLGDQNPYRGQLVSDGAPGKKGVDDDQDGQVDEGHPSDDDEDGRLDEDYSEWPFDARDTVVSSGLVADLNGTGSKQIIFGHDYSGGPNQEFSRGGVLRVMTPEGSPAFGFPRGDIEQVIWSSPVVADLDGDGKYEILHGSGLDTSTVQPTPAGRLVGRLVYAWRSDGRAFRSCPGADEGCFATTQGRSFASFAVGDLDADGNPELVIATTAMRNEQNQPINSSGQVVPESAAEGQQLYVFNSEGALLPGFPVRPNPGFPGTALVSSPILADVDADGFLEIIIGVRQGLMVFNRFGQVIPGMGVHENLQDSSATRDISSTAAVADIDLDGTLDLVWTAPTGANGGLVHVVKLSAANSNTYVRSWPQWRRVPNRNAIFGPVIGLGQAWETSGMLNLQVQWMVGRRQSGLMLTADLRSIGGPAAQPIPGGQNGYAFLTYHLGTLAPGRYEIPVTLAESPGRTDTQTIIFVRRSSVAGQLVSSATSLNFGSITQGESTFRQLTLVNTGTSAVTINSAASTNGEYVVTAPAFPQVVAPGASVLVNVRYRPGPTSGIHAGTLNISSSAGAISVGLTGTVPIGNAGCAVTLNKITPNQTGTGNVPFSGQNGTIRLTASPTGCDWRGSTDALWFSVFPTSGKGNVDLHYTIYPNTTVRPRSARLNVNGTVLFITQDQAGQDEDERFIGLLYQGTLGRYPSAEHLQSHVNQLRATSRLDKAVEFFNTAEFKLIGRFVAALYKGLLRRIPEYNGWQFQRNAILLGWTTQQSIAGNFLTSEEFRIQNPAPMTNEQFIVFLYRQVLGRPADPSPSELQFHLNSLKEGTLAQRSQKATEFLLVPEFDSRISSDVTATLLYFVFFQRDPTAEEFERTRSRLAADRNSLRQIISEMINAAEFRALLI